jgi:hypothetical protein
VNPQLLLLCREYVKCYGVLDCLINLDGLEAESLKLFRLCKDRCSMLENEMLECIVAREVTGDGD